MDKLEVAKKALWQIFHDYHEDNPQRHLLQKMSSDVAREALIEMGETVRKIKVVIDESVCVQCGLCEGNCPGVFDASGDTSKVKEDADLSSPCIEEAVGDCPVNAITIEK